MPNEILVGIDRDGTLIKDENYYLGSQENWQELIDFMPGVIGGMRRLKFARGAHSYILSNQAGVALEGIDGAKNFSRLTEAMVRQVNDEIMWKLCINGAEPEGIFFCPYVDKQYVRKAEEKGRSVNPLYVRENDRSMKPNIGLLERAAMHSARELGDFSKIYVIGDRLSDVQMAHNAEGIGILVPDYKTRELGDVSNVEQLMRDKPEKTFICERFDLAIQLILEQVS